jgi:hypothetical protein
MAFMTVNSNNFSFSVVAGKIAPSKAGSGLSTQPGDAPWVPT